MAHRIGIVWMTDDLRMHDNPLIVRAAAECEQLIFCYFVSPKQLRKDQFGCQPLGEHRQQFLAESLLCLHSTLEDKAQTLNVFQEDAVRSIEIVCANLPITHIYRSSPVASNELYEWASLKMALPDIQTVAVETRCLFSKEQLAFEPENFPQTFSKFRRKAEKLEPVSPISPVSPESNASITSLPEPLSLTAFSFERAKISEWIKKPSPYVKGGAMEGESHVSRYFASDAPNHYKATRNALDQWESSSKWSFWLADGAISARDLARQLREYQGRHGKNENNDWLLFELLWREYFQWYARAFNQRLFYLNGLEDPNKKRRHGAFYPQRFKQWCMGTTPYPLVNACMRQLNATGYMSNRGRQIVASALIHELGLDWRCGAAYFEQQLIDYDPASNWGNWQYIAGVGADPRGGRHFNIEKQTQMYDPDRLFINRWTDQNEHYRLDYVDAADWPIL